MRPVWTEERKQAARAICALYAGTPHRNRMARPGKNGGVDCIHFVAEVLSGAGVILPHTLPAYDERLGVLRARNVIEDILLQHLHAEIAPEPEFGDIVICTCGRQSNHVGIVIDGQMWHVPGRGWCGPEALGNWAARVQSFVRLTDTGLRQDPARLQADALRIAPAPAVG